MGDFERKYTIARDGKTKIDDPNVFGQEWQVLSLNFLRHFVGLSFPNSAFFPRLQLKLVVWEHPLLARQLCKLVPRDMTKPAPAPLMLASVADVLLTGNIDTARRRRSFLRYSLLRMRLCR